LLSPDHLACAGSGGCPVWAARPLLVVLPPVSALGSLKLFFFFRFLAPFAML
jgi:hypothetical protein